MQSSYLASPTSVSFHLSRNFVAVFLFCLLGLTISIAVLSFVPAEEFAAILAY